MLERERALGMCATALEHTVAGAGALVVVEGPPGIGKTEMVRAVRAVAAGRGFPVLSARGVEVEREVAFGGVRQLLEPVLRSMSSAEVAQLLSGSANPVSRLFGASGDDSVASADSAFAMLNGLYWVVASLADAGPLLVAVDDAQWVDESSVRFLQFLLPRIEELRLLVIVATHLPNADGDGALERVLADPSARVIRLDPLTSDAVAELVRDRLDAEPDPIFVDACMEVTAGNPFYLVELLRDLAEKEVRPGVAEAELARTIAPHSISLALRVRIAGVRGGTQIAKALAVLGDGARLDHVADLAASSTADAVRVADALTRRSIFTSESELSFVHPILRTAVYTDIGPHQRAQMHARAARLLSAAGAPIHLIVAHLMRAEPIGDPWVTDALRTAAAAAHAQGARETAVGYLRRALLEPPDVDARPAVLLELGNAEASAAHPDGVAHLLEAYALADDARIRSRAAMAADFALVAAGRIGEAIAVLAHASDELAHEDPDSACQLDAQLIAVAINEPTLGASHRARLDRLSGEDLPCDSPGSRMLLTHVAYRRMWRSEDASRAAFLVQRALAERSESTELNSASELNSAAMTLICADHLPAAQQLLDSALSQARERGSRLDYLHVSFLRSVLAYRWGDLRSVEAEARGASSGFHAGHPLGDVMVACMLTAALLERGAVAEATDVLGASGFPRKEVPPPLPFLLFLSVRGRLRLASGDLDGGLADLIECGRRTEHFGVRNPVFVPWRADAALALRVHAELDAARALANEELAAARDWGTPGAIGSAQRLLGLLNSGESAIVLLSQAVDNLAASPARLEYARALVDLGAALRRANHRAAAREPLMHGLDLADQCGAIVLRQRAHEELASVGVHPRRARLTGIDALTATELRVARMAASGLGNLEIAQQLFVTRKTIEKHLGNAYLKLGVNSREALSAVVEADAP